MEEKFYDILKDADWDELTPKLINYADWRLRKYHWRRVPAAEGGCGQLLADGKSADDFVNDAIDKLLAGLRAYNFDESLEFNLKGIIRSLIWNHKKKSDRKPLDEQEVLASEDGEMIDTTLNVADPKVSDAEKNERIAAQKRLLDDFETSIADDPELSLLLTAYQIDITKNALIEQETGLTADRVSELKRKLESRLVKFNSRHPDAEKAAIEYYS